jgi:hypothetical protein
MQIAAAADSSSGGLARMAVPKLVREVPDARLFVTVILQSQVLKYSNLFLDGRNWRLILCHNTP